MTSATAKGTFEVKLSPAPAGEIPEPEGFVRMSLDKQFSGGLDATSKGVMLSAGTDVKNSAGYVALERVTGILEGRAGAFVLQHSGILNRGVPQLTISVVPDSGTGELIGLSGQMTIDLVEGKHSYSFEFTLGVLEFG